VEGPFSAGNPQSETAHQLPDKELKMTRNWVCLSAALALLFAVSWNAVAVDIDNMADQSTFRCSGGVVAQGESDRAVLQKCGEPLDVVPKQDVGPIWIYHFGQSKFMYYLAFKFGKLERIVSAPCDINDDACYDLR